MRDSFMAGQVYSFNGVEFHISKGRKESPGPGEDLRLDIYVPRQVAVSMSVGYFMADFYAQNERVLYPFRGDEAGERYIKACRGAQVQGWRVAADQLALERQLAAERRAS